jgi:hypothetical protein
VDRPRLESVKGKAVVVSKTKQKIRKRKEKR